MKRMKTAFMRTAMTLSAAFLITTGSDATPIDITFSARGEATNVESVTITNLTHPDIPAVTLIGSATLHLVDQSEKMTGDVNSDGTVDVADIATVISIMAGKARIAPGLQMMRAGTPALLGANAVKMDFHTGDILRFEGKSGEMRTIVVNYVVKR